MILSIFFFSYIAHALECLDPSYPVEFKKISGDIHRWCQKNDGGKYIKHGPYEITEVNGKVLLQYYHENQLQKRDAALPFAAAKEKSRAANTADTINNNSGTHQYDGTENDIPNDVRKKRPSSKMHLSSSATGAFELAKDEEVYWTELRSYEIEQLKELEHKFDPSHNEYAYLFSRIPGMDHESMKKLALYMQTLIPEKKSDRYIEYFEKNPLAILFEDFIKISQDNNVDKLRSYLYEFKFPPDYQIYYLPNMMNIVAFYGKQSSMLLALIANKKISLNKVSNCFFHRKYCNKNQDYVTLKCSPIEVAAYADNLVALNYLLEQGVSPEGVAEAHASPLGFALIGFSRKSFERMMNIPRIKIDRHFKAAPCHFIDGNLMGHTLAGFNMLDFYQALIAKGFRHNQASPETLRAVMNREIVPGGLEFSDLQEMMMNKIKKITELGYDLKTGLKNFEEALNLAVRSHFFEVIKQFISLNVIDINKYGAEGRTPVFESFDSTFWPEGKMPKDWQMSRANEKEDKKNARFQTLQIIFNNGGRRQIRDKHEKGMIHYATLELPFSQPLLDYLKEKGSF